MNIAKIPVEWADHWNATTNKERFLRDLCGIRVRSKEDFIKNRSALYSIWDFGRANPYRDELMYSFEPSWKCENKDKRRFIHIDYGVSNNAAGLAMCHVSHFINPTGNRFNLNCRPFVVFDVLARIPAGRGEDIILTDIESMITNIAERGFLISLTTFDKFQSVQTMQNLKRRGFMVSNLSMDKTTHYIKLVSRHENPDGFTRESTHGSHLAPFEAFKDLVNEYRVKIPFYKPLLDDIGNSLKKIKVQKVIGKSGQSLDILEAAVGAGYNAIMNSAYLDSSFLKDLSPKDVDTFYQDKAYSGNQSSKFDENNTSGYIEDDFYRDY